MTVRVEARLRKDYGELPRSGAERQAARSLKRYKQAGDDTGHAIAHRFLQDAGAFNLFPQNKNLNRSAYKVLENEWADWIDHGMEVRPLIKKFPPGASRPKSLRVTYDVIDPKTGDRVYKSKVKWFKNQDGQRAARESKEFIRETVGNR